MKTTTIPARTIVTYNFSEISPEAQDRAIQDRQRISYDDPSIMEFHVNDAIDSLNAFCEALFFRKIRYYSIDYASAHRSDITFPEMPENTEELTGQRLRTWIINNWSKHLWERKPQGKYTNNENTGKWSYKRRSRIIFVETCCPFTGMCYDETLLDPIRKFVKARTNDSTTLEDLISEAGETLLKDLESEYDYQTSEEAAREALENDDFQFNADGSINNEI